ncbi:MAG: type II toxin-antitoxin system Phd/YefM family antitoxin [Solirubrobacteraceae bacterium]
MARSITQRELRNQSGDVMRGLDRGESFLVTRNGVPVGELAPVSARRWVGRRAVAVAIEDVPSIDHDAFRADLDAYVDQDAEPRG